MGKETPLKLPAQCFKENHQETSVRHQMTLGRKGGRIVFEVKSGEDLRTVPSKQAHMP